jgi:hypothetical protein
MRPGTRRRGSRPAEYTSVGSGYWSAGRGQGRNWMGRLLELVRSEIGAERAGTPARLPALRTLRSADGRGRIADNNAGVALLEALRGDLG